MITEPKTYKPLTLVIFNAINRNQEKISNMNFSDPVSGKCYSISDSELSALPKQYQSLIKNLYSCSGGTAVTAAQVSKIMPKVLAELDKIEKSVSENPVLDSENKKIESETKKTGGFWNWINSDQGINTVDKYGKIISTLVGTQSIPDVSINTAPVEKNTILGLSPVMFAILVVLVLVLGVVGFIAIRKKSDKTVVSTQA